jgi:UDP-N-acetylmuramoyl-tripeptide--D-alanyl-D-alanine ligase
VIRLDTERIVAAAGAEVVREGGPGHPERGITDSNEVDPGDLFFGLRGEHADGSEFAGSALEAGAWGAVLTPERAGSLSQSAAPGWVLATPDPLRSLQDVATEWRRELGCPVVGITGSTGKTSVKDICRAILPFRVHASPENYNTEIGLPLTVLSAPEQSEVIVLEMAMRGMGQIAELCRIAEPDVGAITNIGPVHLELLGTLEAIVEAKAEILRGLRERGTAVVPADAEALEPHLHDRLVTITFGAGGDVFALRSRVQDGSTVASVGTSDGEQEFRFPFTEAHNLTNALAAIGIGMALDAPLAEMSRKAPEIVFSRLRGELLELRDGVVIVNDCYNANPTSMRAALDHLASLDARGRRMAVLGEMAELGPQGPAYHREVGAHARDLGIGPIVGVGELARDYAPDEWVPDARAAVSVTHALIGAGDTVLVKGSRAVGLELLSDELAAMRQARPASEPG